MWNDYDKNPPPVKPITGRGENDFLFDIEVTTEYGVKRIVIPVKQYMPTVGDKVAGYFVYGFRALLDSHFNNYRVLFWMDYPEPNV